MPRNQVHLRNSGYDVLVQVMGSVKVHGVEPEMTTDQTELVGLLACLRGHTDVHIGLVCSAIAPNVLRKTVENRISKLRKALGQGSDGHDMLPPASAGGSGVYSVFRLSNLVLTDVDLLEHRLHTAHELGSTDALRVLRDGLDLMEGPLFRARRGFDGWPHSEGVVVAMETVVTNYARLLMDLAIEVDEIPLVIRTTASAHRVLDNPITELPLRQMEAEYADLCDDDELAASRDKAREFLQTYLREDDSLAAP